MAIASKASQEFISVKDIKDGVLILKDGGLRVLLMASSVNFALKSSEEREAIIFQFQDFLNTLDFSVQIHLESRRLDIRPYLALLEERQKDQVVDLMKIQIQEYIEFIRNFAEGSNIMNKSFFVVVPYTAAIVGGKGATGLGGLFGQKGNSKASEEAFLEAVTQLEQRVSIVSQGLSRCGIRAERLNTETLTELFYKIYNPGETEKPIQVQQ